MFQQSQNRISKRKLLSIASSARDLLEKKETNIHLNIFLEGEGCTFETSKWIYYVLSKDPLLTIDKKTFDKRLILSEYMGGFTYLISARQFVYSHKVHECLYDKTNPFLINLPLYKLKLVPIEPNKKFDEFVFKYANKFWILPIEEENDE